MSIKIQTAHLCLATSLLIFTGCSREMSEAILETARNRSSSARPIDMPEVGVDDEFLRMDSKPVSLNVMPSPERTNPFEMSAEFLSDSPNETAGRKREIRVLGFIELEVPSVMISLDGRTQVFKAGETFDKVTVHEIMPPRARLSYDGVTWNASIFDRRENNK